MGLVTVVRVEFELRLAEAFDEPFLLQLFAGTHGQQFSLLPLAPAQRDMLVRMQFDAQRGGYRQQFPGSQEFVIIAGGEPAGRLWVDESGAEVRVLDIAIAPVHQRQGLGTAVLKDVIAKAVAAGKGVRLSVARMEVATFEWYRRLGFKVCREDEVYIEMERQV